MRGIRSGLRISELLALKVGQVWDGNKVVDRFYVRRQATKGKEADASIVMHPEAAQYLSRWIKSGKLTGKPENYLFPGQTNGHLNRRWMWNVLSRAFKAAGVTGMAGTNCMRKTFANNVHKALGGDLFRTSKAMRHASPLSTLRYLSFKQEEIDRAVLAT